MKKSNPAKEDYQRLRHFPCEQLWEEEVAAFDRASGAERMQRVAVIRAVGVVFSESGSPEQQESARVWLRSLLEDPEEKIRRYAMTALPKLGGDESEEAALLKVLKKTSSEREKRSLGKTLEKIGSDATLQVGGQLDVRTLRKVEANVARQTQSGSVRLDRAVANISGLRLHLHCRTGLEDIVARELDERISSGAPFRRLQTVGGLVVAEPIRPFTLGDIFVLRCFAHLGIVPGAVAPSGDETERIAKAITSPQSLRVLEAFTEGPVRFRLEYVSKGHQRSAVRAVADRVYALCPALLNDAREALWQMNIRHQNRACTVEMTPRLRPDPRFDYRLGDVPAASHPPLAACMARLAGLRENETVWDPFCGSGLELVERALLGGVCHVIGTDLSEEALVTAQANLGEAAKDVPATFRACDFRDYATVPELRPGSVSLVVSNPPLGRRVPIPDLPGLIKSLFSAAADVLSPRGRLVFVNPTSVRPSGLPLRLESERKIDLGGFHCSLEKYNKT